MDSLASPPATDRIWVATLHDRTGSSPIHACFRREDAVAFVEEEAGRALPWRPIREPDDGPDDVGVHGYEATALPSGRWTVQSCWIDACVPVPAAVDADGR